MSVEDAGPPGGDERFDEDEARGTRMGYDKTSRAPWWWFAIWAIFLAGFVTYYLVYLVPDLRAWGWPR